MDTKKKILIVTAILLVLGAIISYFLARNSSKEILNSGQPQAFPSFPVIPGEKPNTSIEKFEIKTEKEQVSVNNVYRMPDSKPLSFDGVNFKNSSYYEMDYYPNQQGFLIIITSSDIETARQNAENDFLQTLGINKDQACELNVSLTVLPEASDTASGGNYRLSFCPNGKPFPKK